MQFPVRFSPTAPTAPFPLVRPRRGVSVDRLARALTLALAAVAAAMVLGAVGLGFYAQAHAGRIYEGVTVAGVSVGGLSEAEAAARLEASFAEYAAVPLSLEAEGQRFDLTPGEVGADIDGAATARDAFAVGREGSLWGRSRAWARGLAQGTTVAPRITVDQGRLEARLREIAPAVVRAPVDARVDVDAAGRAAVLPEAAGVGLDVAGTAARMMGRFATLGRDPVLVATASVPPAVTADVLAPSLPSVQAAVDAPLVLAAAEGNWAVAPDDLRKIVGVSGADGAIAVDAAPLEVLVEEIADQIDRPATDAGIRVDDNGGLVAVPGVDAAKVDVDASVAASVQALQGGRDQIDLVVERDVPAITDEEAAAGIVEAEGYLSDGIRLTWDELMVEDADANRRWEDGAATLGRDDLLNALVIYPRPEADDPFLFDFDLGLLQESLGVVADDIDDPAVNASFRLVNSRVTLVEASAPGRTVDRDASLQSIIGAVYGGKDQVELTVVAEEPKHTADDRYGITVPDVLGESSTSYANSSEPRRKNVERAVELEGGWLVAPGEDFSYVEHVGKADESMGFVTGFGIVADENGGVTTAPVIGGGICQVSTTIFQAAFWAGLPFPERYSHPYWLTGYGQPPRGMTGLDAMVAIEEDWTLDLRITNTTPDWIAVEVTSDGQTVRSRVLGTDPQWEVEVDEPVVTNVVPKESKMNYSDSPELPRGQELVVETAQDGFDVTIERRVKDGRGQEILSDAISGTYAPARNLTLRGTGR